MTATSTLVLLACLALSQARLVRRDAPASSPLEDLQKHAAEFRKTFDEQFNELVNSKNTQEVNKALKEGSDSILQQLSALSNSLQDAVSDASQKTKETVEATRASLQRKTDELRAQHPDVEQNAATLQENLKGTLDHVFKETQNLAKAFAGNVEETNEKLAPKLKAAYDDFVKQAEAVQKKLHDAASH